MSTLSTPQQAAVRATSLFSRERLKRRRKLGLPPLRRADRDADWQAVQRIARVGGNVAVGYCGHPATRRAVVYGADWQLDALPVAAVESRGNEHAVVRLDRIHDRDPLSEFLDLIAIWAYTRPPAVAADSVTPYTITQHA